MFFCGIATKKASLDGFKRRDLVVVGYWWVDFVKSLIYICGQIVKILTTTIVKIQISRGQNGQLEI